MLPWGHAAFGYLLYSAWRKLRSGNAPSGTEVIPLLIGTQAPDLVDKPLAWTFTILPSGRSLGHSALVLLSLSLLVAVWLRSPTGRDSRGEPPEQAQRSRVAVAFLFGWTTHLLGDSYRVLVDPETCLSFLLWPITPVCDYAESSRSILGFLLDPSVVRSNSVGIGLLVIAGGWWILDGKPGIELSRRIVSKYVR